MPWQVGKKIYKGEDWVDEVIGRDRFWGRAAKYLLSDAYTLIELLPEQGGWGHTWLAKDKSGKKGVIKTPQDRVFTPQYTQVRDQYLDLFDKEAATIKACQHDHIVKLEGKFYLKEENDRPCIVMEYVAGMSVWDRVVTRGALEQVEALAYIRQIGDALDWMHKNSFLHHDVKPNNIMIREISALYGGECNAVLIDFGMSRRFIPDLVRSYEAIPGNGGFTAPEIVKLYERMQMEDMEKLYIRQSPKLDVYSLAATLYFMLSGRTPIRRPRQLPDVISPEVQDAIWKGLEEDPDQRSANVREWLNLLPLRNDPLYSINGILTYDYLTPDVLGHRRQRLRAEDLAVKQKLISAPVVSNPPISPNVSQNQLNQSNLQEVTADDEVIDALFTEEIETAKTAFDNNSVIRNVVNESWNSSNNNDLDEFQLEQVEDSSEIVDDIVINEFQNDVSDNDLDESHLENIIEIEWLASSANRNSVDDDLVDEDWSEIADQITNDLHKIELNPVVKQVEANDDVIDNDLVDIDWSEVAVEITNDIQEVELTPDVKQVETKTASEYFNSAYAKYQQGDKQGVIADLTEAIRLNPSLANAYYNRGNAKYELGDKQAAITDYNEAIRLDPNLADVFYNRGVAKSCLGDKEGAIADYNEAIRIKPDHDESYNNRGNVKSDLGDQEGAIADYNEAIHLNPNYALAYNNRGKVKSDLGDKQGAIADYNEAIRIKPDHDGAYYNRGLTKKERNEKQGALADFQKALELYQLQGNTEWYNKSRDRIRELGV